MENKVRRGMGDRSPSCTSEPANEVFFLTLLSSGLLTKDCYRSFRHLRIRSVLREQVRRHPQRYSDHTAAPVTHTSHQFWTVLYKLLQREAAAAFHSANIEGWAGGISGRRYRGNLVNPLPQRQSKWETLTECCILCSHCCHHSVGACSVLQQQDHLWPGWGEAQRNHLNTGGLPWRSADTPPVECDV